MANKQFESLAELRNQLKSLDRAEERDVFTNERLKPVTSGIETKEYKAVWNSDQNHLSCIASRKYAIVQHIDVFEPLVEALISLGVEAKGFLRLANEGDKAIVELYFTNQKLVNDDAEGVVTGLRFTNSYDLSMGIYGCMMAKRLVCANGMVLSRFIEAVHKIHAGNKVDFRETMTIFVKDVIEANTLLQKYISECLADTIEWNLCKKLMMALIKTDKHSKGIIEVLDNMRRKKTDKQLNRWDVYNAVTFYATHGKKISDAVEEALQKNAQAILVTKEYAKLVRGLGDHAPSGATGVRA